MQQLQRKVFSSSSIPQILLYLKLQISFRYLIQVKIKTDNNHEKNNHENNFRGSITLLFVYNFNSSLPVAMLFISLILQSDKVTKSL